MRNIDDDKKNKIERVEPFAGQDIKKFVTMLSVMAQALLEEQRRLI